MGISEQEVINLAEKGDLACARIAGEYMRYRRKDVTKFKEVMSRKYPSVSGRSQLHENVREVLHFYDFYIICAAVIVVLLWVIIKDVHS